MKHRCISLHAPWSLLCFAVNPLTSKPYKENETRSRYCHKRGPVLIHNAQKWGKQQRHIVLYEEPFSKVLSEIFNTKPGLETLWAMDEWMKENAGKIIGQVNFNSCQKTYFDSGHSAHVEPALYGGETFDIIDGYDYFFGNYNFSGGPRYAIKMTKSRSLEPIKINGSQGFFFYETDEPLKFTDALRLPSLPV